MGQRRGRVRITKYKINKYKYQWVKFPALYSLYLIYSTENIANIL